ncbi:saccharopine dehydrogenase-like oxidoreductase [Epargyreus clarus]|uniref:saccharopine dehydrogenase-like oxidoreductase n=1 Tax=Epargyreus clarus TaxID=520877 RepID=UPI003C30C9DF
MAKASISLISVLYRLMSRLDIVIFGATGFTGQYVVAEMIQMANKYPEFKWGVAGRSQEKLEFVMRVVAESTKADVSNVKIIIANIEDEQSLLAMCGQAKVVVNCCGPYRFYGEPVVKAAIDSKTNYVDVSGEPHFMESMQLKYDKMAQDAGVFVVSGCGFDSIPADLGVLYLQDNFGGTLNSVEIYMSGSIPSELYKEALRGGIIHYGTWESLLYGIWNRNELVPIRKQLFRERMPELKPKLVRRLVHLYEGAWCLPFPGADAAVVRRTQRTKRRPAQLAAYIALSAPAAMIVLFIALLVALFSTFTWGRRLLLKHPRVFSLGVVSHTGPRAAAAAATSFELRLVGRGWAARDELDDVLDRTVVAKVSGKNPGYGATATAVLLSAITILKEKILMPTPGGVMTTGIAFGKTNLTKNLIKHGIKFEITDK